MPLDLELLQSSVDAIKPVANEVVEHFYVEFFQRHPEVRPFFDEKRSPDQQMELIKSLVFIFENLQNQTAIEDYLQRMGRRHSDYGILPQHYQWAAESVLSTLKYFFDDTWTPDLETTWKETLNLIRSMMLKGTQKSPESPLVLSVVPEDELGRPSSIIQQIESTMQELMRASLENLVNDREIRKLARMKAKALIQEVLEQEIAELKGKSAARKAA